MFTASFNIVEFPFPAAEHSSAASFIIDFGQLYFSYTKLRRTLSFIHGGFGGDLL